MTRKFSIVVEGYQPGNISPCVRNETRYFSSEKAAYRAAGKLTAKLGTRGLEYTTRKLFRELP